MDGIILDKVERIFRISFSTSFEKFIFISEGSLKWVSIQLLILEPELLKELIKSGNLAEKLLNCSIITGVNITNNRVIIITRDKIIIRDKILLLILNFSSIFLILGSKKYAIKTDINKGAKITLKAEKNIKENKDIIRKINKLINGLYFSYILFPHFFGKYFKTEFYI
jgi:hypothetical protein